MITLLVYTLTECQQWNVMTRIIRNGFWQSKLQQYRLMSSQTL